MTRPDQPAFPELHVYHWHGLEKDEGKTDNVTPRWNGGLTKREYFAARAMQGIIGNQRTAIANPTYRDVALHAVAQADALIEELNR